MRHWGWALAFKHACTAAFTDCASLTLSEHSMDLLRRSGKGKCVALRSSQQQWQPRPTSPAQLELQAACIMMVWSINCNGNKRKVQTCVIETKTTATQQQSAVMQSSTCACMYACAPLQAASSGPFSDI